MRVRRTTSNKRRRRPKKRYRATTNSMKGTKSSKKHTWKRLRSTGSVQKRAQQGHTLRRQGAWPDIRPEYQTIPRKMRKKKIRKGIASSRRQTLSGEVVARKNKARQGHAKKRGTWPGMKWYYQTNQKSRKKKNTQREFANSRQGTLSG